MRITPYFCHPGSQLRFLEGIENLMVMLSISNHPFASKLVSLSRMMSSHKQLNRSPMARRVILTTRSHHRLRCHKQLLRTLVC